MIKKSVKQRQDSIEMYTQGGRQDLVDQERLELSIIESYLPQQMGADQVASIVQKVIAEIKATSIKDMGAVMKAVQAQTQGAADNKIVSELVRKALQA